MKPVVSFAWTTGALLAGHKTVTRRDWHYGYAERFHAGDVLDAYDKSRRVGGQKVATIRLTHDPILEPVAAMTDADYWDEGFSWLYGHPTQLPAHLFGQPASRESFSPAGFNRWRASGETLWTVRYELLEVQRPMLLRDALDAEIAMSALYWANRVAVSPELDYLPGPERKHAVDEFRKLVYDTLRQALSGVPLDPLASAGRDVLSSDCLFSISTMLGVDPILSDSLAWIAPMVDPVKVFPAFIRVNCPVSGRVDVFDQRRLWPLYDCRKPNIQHDLSELPKWARSANGRA